MKTLFSLLAFSEGTIPRYPEDRQLDNLDERLIEIDIKGHGYSEKAIKKCGLRYMGPSFYENWKNSRHLDANGTCIDPEVQYAEDNVHQNPSFWILPSLPIIKQTIGGNLMPKFAGNVRDTALGAFNACSEKMVENNGIMLPYCHMHQGMKLIDLKGYGDRYLPESSKKCFEGYMYHVGPERMHGVFYDTASTRSVMDHTHWKGRHYAPETEQRDLDALTEVVDFTRKFWRDNVLDNEAIVIANSGNKGSSGQLMKSKIDSVTLKEHYIESYPNFYTGNCSDPDPKYQDDLRCVKYSLEGYDRGIMKWREELYNLIKYGPLNPQSQFVQGWTHPDTPQLMLDQFDEDMVTRFTRFALDSHVGVVTYSHGGNGDPLAVDHDADFYTDIFNRPEYQKCTGTWGEWEQWSNCDRSCKDGIRIRERPCSEGDAGLCDGSERDVQVCNLDPCYQWPEKGWTHWGEWNDCSVTCGGGKRDRRRTCKDDDNDCGGSDYELGDCNTQTCPINQCPLELKINVPDSWHTEAKFPYKMYYHRTEDNDTQQSPRYIKYAKDIELVYENNAWIVRDNDNDRVVLVSFTDAFCPDYISQDDWYYMDILAGELKNDQQISFENAKSGDDYVQGDVGYSATTQPNWTSWSEWTSCDGSCGTEATRTRTHECENELCTGAKVETESCGFADCTEEEKKLPCVADENGTRWRPVYRQWRSNGGIPRVHEDDIISNEGFTFQANPPKNGKDYVNFFGFDNYKIDEKFHMKLIWSAGESITWKQEESIFQSGNAKVRTTSEIVGQNHKGHSELVFHGLSFTKPDTLRFNSLWDGIADMTTEANNGYYHELMDFCQNYKTNWPGYSTLIFNDNLQWDQRPYYATWLSKAENEAPPTENGDSLLGEGEAIQGDNVDCMDTRQYWQYSDRGNNNDFAAMYVEDSSCPEPTETFPTFVRCYGPESSPSEDGSFCSCGDNGTHDSSTGLCACNTGYVQTKYVFFRQPLCVKCNGPGATPGFYGCDCGINMDWNESDGTCSCQDGLVMTPDGTECYDGIDVQFDGEYNCTSSTSEELIEQLSDDITIQYGLTGNEAVNCDRFGYPVVEVKMQPGVKGSSSGTQIAMNPGLSNKDVFEATFVFEIYLNEDFVMPTKFTLPGFYIKSLGNLQKSTRLEVNSGEVRLNGNCDFCDTVNQAYGGSFASISVGEWTKVEMRMKLNDPGQANGEFIVYWNGEEVVRETTLSD